jgi:proliferating cell nuclear antigen
MRLEEAGADERPRIERLLRESGLPTGDLDSSPVRLFVGHDDGQFVGVGGFERYGRDALLRSVAVPDSMRGRGYGRALYRELEARVREAEIDRLYLLTDTATGFFGGSASRSSIATTRRSRSGRPRSSRSSVPRRRPACGRSSSETTGRDARPLRAAPRSDGSANPGRAIEAATKPRTGVFLSGVAVARSNMFKAIVDAETLRTALDSVGVLVDECKIHLNEDGLAIRAVDPANVGMVDLELDASAFESYEADGGLIGVNLTRLEDIAKMADAGQLVQLELDEQTRKLHIQLDGLEYTLALIDPDSIRKEPDLPDLDLPARIVLEGADIDRAVKAADMVSDHIALGVNADAEFFYVDAEGDTDDVHFELARDELIDLQSGAAHSLFSLDYLKDMNRAIPKNGEVSVDLGEEFPVRISFEIAEGMGSVTYMLAPRIQSD